MKRNGPKFEEVTRLGRVVAGEIIATAEQITLGEDSTLRSFGADISLEARSIPTPEEAAAGQESAKATLDGAKADDAPEYVIKDLQREVYASNTTAMVAQHAVEQPDLLIAATQTRYQVVQIGPMVAVAIPGELFVEYALEMKRRVAQDTGRPMILVGYANDYIGYIITPRADKTGGYERAISRVAPSAGRALTEAAMTAVRSMVTPVE